MSVKEADLIHLVEQINKKTGHSTEPYLKVDEVHEAQVGTYCLDGDYSGHKLQQICGINGQVQYITHGFVSRKELYALLETFLAGVEAGIEVGQCTK